MLVSFRYSDEKSHKHHHKHNKVLAEQNDFKHDFFGEEIKTSELEVLGSTKHKKKSRKTDEFSDAERSRKHGEKKKKKSKKEDKNGERAEKKKKKKDKRSKSENVEDAFAVEDQSIFLHEDAFQGEFYPTLLLSFLHLLLVVVLNKKS